MSTPTLLALDTTTEACSAALALGEETLERFELLPRGHAERILPMLDELLAEAGLTLARVDVLGFCRGPGSFTGVRISAGVAQGLAFGADLPVIPVSTLACLAQGAVREHDAERVLAAVDARMGEVYWGTYRRGAEGVVEAACAEAVSAPSELVCPPEAGWVGVGSGWQAHREALLGRCGDVAAIHPQALPRALDSLPLMGRAWREGAVLSAEEALPVYLRDKVTG